MSDVHTILQTKTTEPKKRKRRGAIDAREQKSIDRNDALSKYTISFLKEHVTIAEFLDLLEKTPNDVWKTNLVEKAKEFLTRIPESAEGVEKFSDLVLETWPLLTLGISEAIERRVDVVGLAVRCANRDSATLRYARMKSDPALQSSLDNIKPPAAATSEIDILRLFLSILIGYWGDLGELPKLDASICGSRADCFGVKVYMFEHQKANPPRPENPVVEHRGRDFSCTIKDAEDAKDVVERVREWLGSVIRENEYGHVGALFEKIKSEILSQVEMGVKCGFFCGRPALVDIRVATASAFVVQIGRRRHM